MFQIYIDGLHLLLQYPEFRLAFRFLRYSIFAAIGILLVVLLLHVIFMLGRNSPLYRRRSPRLGWSKRFFPGIALLLAALGGLFWATGKWIASAS